MARRYDIKATALFEGLRLPVTLNLLGNNVYYASYPEVRNYNQYRGTYASYAADLLINELKFNPFNIIKYYTTNSGTAGDLHPELISFLSEMGIEYERVDAVSPTQRFTDFQMLNGEPFREFTSPIPATYNNNRLDGNNLFGSIVVTREYKPATLTTTFCVIIQLRLFPDHAFDNGVFDTDAIHYNGYYVSVIAYFDKDVTGVTTLYGMESSVDNNQTINIFPFEDLNNNMEFLVEDGDIVYSDSTNPYGGTTAVTGGGNGDPYMDVDKIEKVEFPDLPAISAASAGLVTIYNPSLSQMVALSAYLWQSPSFDINDFKRLFASPMDAIIGLSIIPVSPTLGGSQSVMFGNIDSGVVMPKLGSQFVEKDMGSVTIKKWVDCFLDYDETKIEIYVPYCGTHQLDPVEVMGKTLHLMYHIDCLTGGCSAMLAVNGSVMYQWNGTCIANIPVNAINYSTAIQNAVSASASVASMATGSNPISSLAAATNAVLNIKPSIQKGGNMGGAAGIMSVQQPYIMITRPNMSVPMSLNKFTGNTLNVTMKLGTVQGFTQVELIHLDGIPCTQSERDELLSLLHEGVIF